MYDYSYKVAHKLFNLRSYWSKDVKHIHFDRSRLAQHNIPPYDKLLTKVSKTNYYQDFKLNEKEFY